MNTNEYKIIPLTKETVQLYKDCFDNNNSPKKIKKIEWQFLSNPIDNSIVDIAFDEHKKQVAGIYATSFVKFKINDDLFIGAQSLDTITDINYRGKGIFTKLAKNVYNDLQNKDTALVYGFPNGKSIHGFSKKLEWSVLDPVPFLIKPLKTKYFTNKIRATKFLPNINLLLSKFKNRKEYNIVENFSFPNEVDKIWNIFSRNINITVVRNKEYLEWRYLIKPFENYKIAHVYHKNKYKGFVVYTVKDKHNGRIGYIMELIYDLRDIHSGKILLDYATHAINSQNADLILAWNFEHSPSYHIFKKKFFLKMPEYLRPIELHFGVRKLNMNIQYDLKDRKQWYLSYSDSDTV